MVKELNKNDKIKYFLFILITALYVFRGMLVYFKIENIIYFLEIQHPQGLS